MAHSVALNVRHLAEKFGFERIGFLTLTFAEDIDWREAQRRFHSLATGFLAHEFAAYMMVLEFQRNGRPHYQARTA